MYKIIIIYKNIYKMNNDYDCSDIETSDIETSDIKTKHVWTEYYTYIPNKEYINIIEEPEPNFTNYTLFSLNSHLSNWINHNWDSRIELSFPSYIKPNQPKRKYITIVPLVGGEKMYMSDIMISELQKVVNNITEEQQKSILLLDYSSILLDNKIMISTRWIEQMLQYVNIPIIYNPYVTKIGLYVELRNEIDFTSIYADLSLLVINELKEMYRGGYISKPSNNIINNWKLVPVDIEQNIYAPNWEDNRITKSSGNMYNFILNKVNNINTIDYELGDNKVVYHTLSKQLNNLNYIDYIINDNYLRINVENLEMAQKIASLIEYVTIYTEGSVIIKYVTSIDEVNIYKEIAQVLEYIEIISVYKINDNERPYSVSFLFPLDTGINTQKISKQLWEEFNNYHLMQFPTYPEEIIYDSSKFDENIKDTKVEEVEEVEEVLSLPLPSISIPYNYISKEKEFINVPIINKYISVP